MNATTPNIKINTRAKWAVGIVESAGLRVTVSKPGASPVFLVRDAQDNTHLQWSNASTLVTFANGVDLGIQIGRKVAQ